MVIFQFLNTLDKEVIPRDYPEVSTRVVDRVVLKLRQFNEPLAALNILSPLEWTVQSDKKMVRECRSVLNAV